MNVLAQKFVHCLQLQGRIERNALFHDGAAVDGELGQPVIQPVHDLVKKRIAGAGEQYAGF